MASTDISDMSDYHDYYGSLQWLPPKCMDSFASRPRHESIDESINAVRRINQVRVKLRVGSKTADC